MQSFFSDESSKWVFLLIVKVQKLAESSREYVDFIVWLPAGPPRTFRAKTLRAKGLCIATWNCRPASRRIRYIAQFY